MSDEYKPQPIIQIDFPAPNEDEKNEIKMGAQIRALKFFSIMKLAANKFGKARADEYADEMMKHSDAMTAREIDQLILDTDVLLEAMNIMRAALTGTALKKQLQAMFGRTTDIIDESQPEDGPDDDETFFPELR